MGADPDSQTGVGFDLTFKTLFTNFPDVQFFGSHRVASVILWARALDEDIVRKFSIGDGQVWANYGSLTKAEHALNLLDISGLSPDEAMNAMYENRNRQDTLESQLIAADKSREDTEIQLAKSIQVNPDGYDEDLHFAIAKAWSISPENLGDLEIGKGVGILGKLLPDILATPE